MLPLARRERLLVEELDEEVLLYDQDTDGAHALDPQAAAIWRACDGRTDVDAIAARLDLPVDIVHAGLARLDQLGLLVPSSVPGGTTRRDMVKRGLIVATAAGVGGPVIRSIVAPTAAQAASCTPGGAPCDLNNPGACCSGSCLINGGNPICDTACIPGGGTCDLNHPGDCCSGSCLINNGNPICSSVCIPAGGTCDLNNPGDCCSGQCLINNGNPICSA
jgi:Coenzyme PQQ synthesis protein D (PqqD)